MKTIMLVGTGSSASADNASVTPGFPPGAVSGDTAVIVASIRNITTGIPRAPEGWTTLLLDNGIGLAVFAKVLAVDETTMPTVEFTGGVAGATTMAQAFALRFAAAEADLLLHDAAVQINAASAVSINTPALTVSADGCLILHVGWRQDDWGTSPSPPASDTSIFATPSATGDDAGQVAAYNLQTTATNVPADAFTLSSSSAVNAGATLALLPYITSWVTVGGTDAPCDFPDAFNTGSEAACAAMAAVDAMISELTNPPAVRISGLSFTVSVSGIVPFALVDIDPTGVADLVSDPYSFPLDPGGIWLTGHAGQLQHSGTEGNAGRIGSGDDALYQTWCRDFNTTNDPPNGGPAAGAEALITSSTSVPLRLSTEIGITGAGAPTNATIIFMRQFAFRVSD